MIDPLQAMLHLALTLFTRFGAIAGILDFSGDEDSEAAGSGA